MALSEDDLSSTRALVVDGNPTSRAILVNQLKGFGIESVTQCTRVADARRQLEYQAFDIVLCELLFDRDAATGQDLLDDLRRNQLMPFSTVFIMVTSEATYARVAEAAESALDGYLLKPHTAANLADRLQQARARKISLQDIFAALESEDFERAATLCLERFENRGPYWLYAARIGAEILLRIEKYAEAQTLYQAVVDAKTLPWAKLGIARSLLDSGKPVQAISTLENLVSEDPSYVDAYDILGRAQFELGHMAQALDGYKMACSLTPGSITRLQNLGVMTFYCGDRNEAENILGKTVRLGLGSKMFDSQSLVLLAFARLESDDRRGLARCREDFRKLLKSHPDNERHQRLAAIVDALVLIQDRQFAKAVDAVLDMAAQVRAADFDFESASNLLALMAQLAHKAIRLDEVDAVIDTLGLRFCTSRPVSELLAGAAAIHPPYEERIKACNTLVLKYAEHAMSLSLEGDPAAAVKDLLDHGNKTLNAKLIETAHLVLQRYATQIPEASHLAEAINKVRALFGFSSARLLVNAQQRPAGGLSLRIGA